jgi:hypothetical protein
MDDGVLEDDMAGYRALASACVRYDAGWSGCMAGPGNNPVQVLSTGLPLHWEFLRLWTGFELPSSCRTLPCYAAHLNRNSFCAMRWPQIDLVAQDLNDI